MYIYVSVSFWTPLSIIHAIHDTNDASWTNDIVQFHASVFSGDKFLGIMRTYSEHLVGF